MIEYSAVLEKMSPPQFKCHYYNSGAFGFPESANARTLAWIGPEDSTIRPEAQVLTRRVVPPYEATLAKMATRLWQDQIGGRAWVMPKSHWAFELGHGSREWMPALIDGLGLDFGLLENKTNAAAIEFTANEPEPFERFLAGLLTLLHGSDFMIAFPGRGILCTLHHHKQLWWTTTEKKVIEAVGSLADEHRAEGDGPGSPSAAPNPA